MPYSSEKYDYLFDREGKLTEPAQEQLRQKDVFRYRAKTIKSGDMLELEIYPLWQTRNEVRRAKAATTRKAQINQNAKNARKKLIRKINANFTEEDLCITLTYKNSVPDEQEAARDIKNYIRRVRQYRRKNNLPEMKYVYVIEFGWEGGRKKRVHHHVIMSGMDRDAAEALWQNRGYANTRRLQPDDNGLEALARYVVKEPNGGKRWRCSRNLVEPKVTTADRKIKKRKAAEMAEDFENKPAVYFSAMFPDYDFGTCEVKYSDFVAGVYIYAKMKRCPAWESLPAGELILQEKRVRHDKQVWISAKNHKKKPDNAPGTGAKTWKKEAA